MTININNIAQDAQESKSILVDPGGSGLTRNIVISGGTLSEDNQVLEANHGVLTNGGTPDFTVTLGGVTIRTLFSLTGSEGVSHRLLIRRTGSNSFEVQMTCLRGAGGVLEPTFAASNLSSGDWSNDQTLSFSLTAGTPDHKQTILRRWSAPS